MNTSRTLAMIVAEHGSAWERWADQLRADGAEVCMFMQQPGESVKALAARVRSRVSELAPGDTIDQAVVVGGGRTDHAAISARALAIRAIVAPMVEAGRGKIVLAASPRDRFAMMGLASTVAPLVRGTGVDIVGLPRVA